LLLKASLSPESSGGALRCESCGYTQIDFKKHGRFGCAACYDTFKGMLDPMLDGMHKGITHSGKVPQTALARKFLHEKLTKLELDLTDAIKSERYEEAARTRDEISQVKQAANQPPPR
jgi:protein arginine kinase activator